MSPLDAFLGIGWLASAWLKQWQQGQLNYLERGLQTDPARIAEAMELLRSWAVGKGLRPSEIDYVARTPQRQALRFSQSGDETTERHFRTHWVSSELSERQRARLADKASAPELVVILPLNNDWNYHRCGGTGDFLIMEGPGPACLRCAGLGDLEFLGAGNALPTAGPRPRAPAAPWWCASAEPAAATSGRAS